jgi:PadR family transcriptional regulator, regulatory protein PadR
MGAMPPPRKSRPGRADESRGSEPRRPASPREGGRPATGAEREPSRGAGGPGRPPARSGRRRRTPAQVPDRESATREAIAQASRLSDARETARVVGRPGGRGRSGDPFTGELRRREVLPLLVLHLISDTPSYGNQLMDRISSMTEGVLSVNPNTMYPLLRSLEARELIEGNWEHPERRSRRYYSITDEGRAEYDRLLAEVRPFLDSVARSIDEIVREVYG